MGSETPRHQPLQEPPPSRGVEVEGQCGEAGLLRPGPTVGEQNRTRKEGAACWQRSRGEEPVPAMGSMRGKAKGERRPWFSVPAVLGPALRWHSGIWTPGARDPELQPAEHSREYRGPVTDLRAVPCARWSLEGRQGHTQVQHQVRLGETGCTPGPQPPLEPLCFPHIGIAGIPPSDPATLWGARLRATPVAPARPEAGPSGNSGRQFWLSHLGERCSW